MADRSVSHRATCTYRPGLGEACGAYFPLACKNYLRCVDVPDGGRACLPLANGGEACNGPGDCVDGYCATACYAMLSDGQTCPGAYQCRSGHCGDAGVGSPNKCFASCFP